VSDKCVLAAGKLLLSESITKNFESTKSIFEVLANAAQKPESNSTDTRRLSLVVIRTICRVNYDLIAPHLGLLAPAIFTSVRDMVIPVKLAAEQAFIAIFQTTTLGDKNFDVSQRISRLVPYSWKIISLIF